MTGLRTDGRDKEIILILSCFLNIINDTVVIVCFPTLSLVSYNLLDIQIILPI